MTPEEKLCSRTWRLGHSAWLLWSILGMGLVTWVGFLINGVRIKSRKWIVAAGFWALFVVVYMVFFAGIETGTKANPANTPAANVAGGYLVFGWIAGIVHSMVWRREWLRRRASLDDTPWYGSETASASQAASPSIPGASPTTESIDSLLRNPGSSGAALSQPAEGRSDQTPPESYGPVPPTQGRRLDI